MEKRWRGEEEEIMTAEELTRMRLGMGGVGYFGRRFVRLALQNEGVTGKGASSNGLKQVEGRH